MMQIFIDKSKWLGNVSLTRHQENYTDCLIILIFFTENVWYMEETHGLPV